MGTEIELKLSVPPGQDQAVLKSAALKTRRVRLGAPKALVTTYYDTAKGALRAKDIYLRVRQSGTRFVQAVKTSPAPGLLAERGEWEWPLTGPTPDLTLAQEAGLKPIAKRARKGDVVPVFASEIARRVATIGEGETVIEIAFDTGTLKAGRRSEAIHEIELELKHGSPAALFALARDLVAHPGVRPAIATKAERGFDLATGTVHRAVKAIEAELDAGATPSVAAADVLDSCAAQAAANLPLVIDKRMPEAIHQLRVAMRRLKAALAIFKHELPPERRKHLKAEASWLADAVAPARDLDVMLGETLKAAAGPDRLSDDLLRLRRRLAQVRRTAWAEAIAAAGSPRAALLVLEIAEVATTLRRDQPDPAAVPLSAFARECLDSRLETVLALGQSIDTLHSDARHSLRLALKKLRYAADFFAGLFPKKAVKAELKALGRLQDAFGGFNDAAVVDSVLRAATADVPEKRRAPLDRAALFVNGWAAHRGNLAWADARRRWDAFAKAEPFWRSGL